MLDPFFELPDMRSVEKAVQFKRALFEHPDRELYAYYWVMAGFSPAFLAERFDVVERLAKARAAKDALVTGDVERWLSWVDALRRNWMTEAEFAGVEAPTLIVATELDSWHAGPTVGMAREIEARLRHAELVVLDKVGTFVLIEDPQRFLEAVMPFYERLIGADQAMGGSTA